MLKRRHSLQMRIIMLSLAFSSMIALGICAVSLVVVYRNYLRANSQSVEYSLQVAANQLRQNVSEIDDFADWCTVNSTIRSYIFGNVQTQQVLTVYDTLLNKYSSQYTARYLDRILITDNNGRILQQGMTTTQSLAITGDGIYQLPGFSEGTENLSWTMLEKDPLIIGNSKTIIPVMRKIASYSSNAQAQVYIAVSSRMITDVLQETNACEDCELFWIMNDQMWRVSGNELIALEPGTEIQSVEEIPDYVSLMNQQTRLIRYNEQLALAYPVGVHDLYIAQLLQQPVIWDQLPSMFPFFVMMLGGLSLLGLLLGLVLRQMIAVTVQALQKQLARISEGDFTPNPDIEWDNEMGDIGRGINGLSRSISTLMEKRLDDERQKKDLEYRMLQNQINPHFIYNTLNSIKWMAAIQHATGIVEMTMALSRLLKSVSKGNERLVTLQEEFALLNDYFTIQHYRYGGTIMLDVSYIEDERLCQNCMIPRFTLQPLVANAIFHGIEPKGCAGNIEIIVTRDPCGDTLIVLKDNGVGMDEEMAAKVLRAPEGEEAEAKYRHVGMWNVHRRLQYSFGEEYGLSISSQPGVGTSVTIRLPPAHNSEEESTD